MCVCVDRQVREYTRLLGSVRRAAAAVDPTLIGSGLGPSDGSTLPPAAAPPDHKRAGEFSKRVSAVMWREFGKLLGAQAINGTQPGMPKFRPDRSRRAW